MAEQLSFVPEFHQHVELSGMSGWMLITAPGFDPMRHLQAIIEEQRKIEREGFAIITLNPKH